MTAKRGSARHAVQLDRDPDQVWALLGAPDRVHEWFPGIASCTVDGDQRVVVTGSGIPMPEQLLTVDPVLRRFQYRITAPMFTEHLSTIDVHRLRDGSCLAVYSVDADPAPLALVIAGAARAGLESLDRLLAPAEGPAPATTASAASAASTPPRKESP
jgi:hypothetical protein